MVLLFFCFVFRVGVEERKEPLESSIEDSGQRLIDGAKLLSKVKGAGARAHVERLALNGPERLVEAGGSCTSNPNTTMFSVKLKTKGICYE